MKFTNCNMNILNRCVAVLLLIFGLQINIHAQNVAERKFLASIDSLDVLMRAKFGENNFQAAEDLCQEMIGLYDTQASQLSEAYAYFKYAGYYNMACMQVKQGKKQEAASNLAKAYAPKYTREQQSDTLPQIVYAQADDPNLVRVREYFQLDSVAVAGDEIATIKRILTYIHDEIRHDGQNSNPEGGNNSINYAEVCKDGSRGLNCRGLATVLNECYLAMGIPSRVITCMPKTYITDCHVINAVYSSTLGKWLWIDPTNNAWVTDDRGNMLSIQEVRERLISGQPVQVNEEANWNNQKKTMTEEYLYDYMAKNLFYLESWTRYGFNTESDYENLINYIFLQPTGCESSQRRPRNLSVNDDRYFWQVP